MLMSLREAHSKFKEEHPSLKLGITKFCDLQPTHVKLFDTIPHQVCVCSYHENEASTCGSDTSLCLEY